MNELPVHSQTPDSIGEEWSFEPPSTVALTGKQGAQTALIIPLCGQYFVDVSTAMQHPGPKVLVIKNELTGETYRAAIVTQDSNPTIPPPPSPPLDPSVYANQAFGSYFNVNVTSYVQLPRIPALYSIKVEYANHQSNEVRVSVIDHR